MRAALALLGVVLASAGGFAWWLAGGLPPTLPRQAASIVLRDRSGGEIAVLARDGARDARPLPLAEMGDWIPKATVWVEDGRFWDHGGVDVFAIGSVLLRSATRARVVAGASTITQQLAKMAAGRTDRDWLAKAGEMRIALAMERSWSKEQILEAYLNRLDYGRGRIGPEAAALHYFGKHARDLSLAEAVYLAGLPQAPGRLGRDQEAAARRFAQIARRLSQRGLVPAGAELESSCPRPIHLPPASEAPHFAALAGCQPRGGPTSLDLSLQGAIGALLRSAAGWADMAVVVVDNRTGAVRAMASTSDPRGLDPATLPRSCGSTLKPFVYLYAFERGILTPDSLVEDALDDLPYSDYQPRNYARRSLGTVSAREALACSLNVPAVRVLAAVGARDCFNWLRGWGFELREGFDACGAGFVLGNARVTPLELAGAYAALARGGTAWAPMLRPGVPAWVAGQAGAQSCSAITSILSHNEARQRGFGRASPLELPFAAAVKTGTSSGFRDGWCVGFDADHTVVVWTGRLDGHPIGELPAVRTAAPLWSSVMRLLHARGSRPLDQQATQRASAQPAPSNPTPSATPLRILFPGDGSTVVLSRALAIERQRLLPESNMPGTRWWMDGKAMPLGGFALETGTHQLVAAAAGERVTVAFRVE